MKKWLIGTFLFVSVIVFLFAVFVKLEWSQFSDRFAAETTIDFSQFLPKDEDKTLSQAQERLQEAPFDGWKFAVVGDTEDGGAITDAIVADIAARRDVALVVHVGDVSSRGDESKMREVKDAFGALDIPTYYVPGNNDLVYDEATERRVPRVYKRVFGSESYALVTHHNAELYLLDNSYRRIGFSDDTLTWLQAQLNNSSPEYRFLFFHRPLKVPGEAIVGDDETPNSRAQNDKFIQLISQHTINHIFNGHIHSFLQYRLGSIPVTVTGGGGAYPQAILGGEAAAYFHYVIVTVPHEAGNTPHVQVVEINAKRYDPTNQSRD